MPLVLRSGLRAGSVPVNRSSAQRGVKQGVARRNAAAALHSAADSASQSAAAPPQQQQPQQQAQLVSSVKRRRTVLGGLTTIALCLCCPLLLPRQINAAEPFVYGPQVLSFGLVCCLSEQGLPPGSLRIFWGPLAASDHCRVRCQNTSAWATSKQAIRLFCRLGRRCGMVCAPPAKRRARWIFQHVRHRRRSSARRRARWISTTSH